MPAQFGRGGNYMKFRKTSAVLLAVLMAIFSVPAPAVSAETGVVFSLSCSLGEEESPELGDTVTYTVGINKKQRILCRYDVFYAL